jgi:hypothetical protein
VTDEPDAHPGVLLLVPDYFHSGVARVVDQPVILVDGRDVTDHSQDCVSVACQMRGLQVNVVGGAPGVVGGKKHTTLEHEVICPRRGAEPIKEALEAYNASSSSVARPSTLTIFCMSR